MVRLISSGGELSNGSNLFADQSSIEGIGQGVRMDKPKETVSVKVNGQLYIFLSETAARRHAAKVRRLALPVTFVSLPEEMPVVIWAGGIYPLGAYENAQGIRVGDDVTIYVFPISSRSNFEQGIRDD